MGFFFLLFDKDVANGRERADKPMINYKAVMCLVGCACCYATLVWEASINWNARLSCFNIDSCALGYEGSCSLKWVDVSVCKISE